MKLTFPHFPRRFVRQFAFWITLFALPLFAADKKIVLIAGKQSHGPGDHEFRAGCLLLKKCLDQMPGITSVVHSNGWPKQNSAFDAADAVLIYADGGAGHPILQGDHREVLSGLVKKGVGLGCAHYGVEIPSTNGGPELLEWIGGYYEHLFSVNPMWKPEFTSFPDHPITRGVKPFSNKDEWYFNIHFREDMKGITPILVAKPSDAVRQGRYVYPAGPYDHIKAASGREEAIMWAYERPDGGRGFGFTGGHTHANWGDPNQLKVVLNALLWIAKADVPPTGVPLSYTADDLKQNLDPKRPASVEAKAKPVDHTFGPEAARADVKKLIVAQGLEATLFASEPMMVNPCDMDIDERGRVWITEGANYRKWGNPPLRPQGDRIIVLEDTNGDGVADKQTTFYQGTDVNSALGICVLGKKVIVSSAPNVFVFTDNDGDGKADKKEILFTGVKGVQHDHAVHAFVFGPDGKLYFNFGNAGEEIRDKEGKPIIDIYGNTVAAKGKPYRQGMVFRCNMDGSEFEVLGHNFRNNYEVCIDSFGTLWQSDNDDDGNRGVRVNYVMEFGNFGYTDEITGASWGTAWEKAKAKGASETERPIYHWYQYDPGVVPNLLVTGNGSPTGISIYEGRLLPEVFRNQIIHCDAGPKIVRAYPVKNDGAGYSATTTNILGSSENWFRPADVCVAPDGSLYIADWNDAGVGGHNMADRELDKMTGRVYRVAPAGNRPSVPKFDLSTAAGCVAALQSPNQATRYLAWTELHNMQGKAEKELVKLWKTEDPRMRARAIQLLARVKGSEKKRVSSAITDRDSDIRIAGLRTARLLHMDVIPLVKKLAKDPSPQVRRECAIALRHNKSPDAPKLWTTLARQYDGKDRWYLEALGIAADKQEDKFFEAWLAQAGNSWDTPAGREIIWRSRSAKAAPLLVKIITDKNTDPKQRDHYMRALDFIKGPEKEAALVEIATSGLN